MSYIALYREFRPINFEEVIGQEHVTETLRRQVENGRVAHAYLFSGGRGSGKTSTAKILSRAINCLNPKNGEPCNECEVCKAALEGALTDITEIDAASNNGVDNIRDIRDEAQFLPTVAKYRVYIIDEVHMLSTGAFNALLKTLEEPPAHVIFILATTEPQKLPVTILSRCQRFDFKRISIANICKTLKKCSEKIGITIDDNAINLIARMADGAMRDAYSILDRCIADGETSITESKVRELVGIPEFEYLKKFAELIIDKNSMQLIEFMESLISEGKNLEVFLSESIKFFRDILILKMSNELSGFSEEEVNVLKELAAHTNSDELIYIITKLSSVQSDMKWSSDTEVAFETGVLKVLYDETETKATKAISKPSVSSVAVGSLTKEDANKVSSAIQNEVSNNSDLKNKVLTKLKENCKMRLCVLLMNASIMEADSELIHIVFGANLDDVSKAYLQQEDSKKAIKEAVIEVTHKELKVKYVFEK